MKNQMLIFPKLQNAHVVFLDQMPEICSTLKDNSDYGHQRWSRGHKPRGQGQGQGQPFRGQTLSRPRTGMLEAKDQGHKRKCSPKKKKVFTKIYQAISTKKRFLKNFSSAPQNFNNSKNTAVLEPRTGQFSRT